mgnify:CR=1 FL=1
MTSYEFYVCKYGGKAVQPDEWQTAYADACLLYTSPSPRD